MARRLESMTVDEALAREARNELRGPWAHLVRLPDGNIGRRVSRTRIYPFAVVERSASGACRVTGYSESRRGAERAALHPTYGRHEGCTYTVTSDITIRCEVVG